MSELKCDEFQDTSQGSSSQTRLLIALVLCSTSMLIELFGGIISGSLAIMTDAVHLLSDVASLLISLLAIRWAKRPPTPAYTYGYHRAEILGALTSIFLIWMMAAFLLVEAWERLWSPRMVKSGSMLVVSILGVLINILLGFVLYDNHNHQAASFAPEDTIHVHEGQHNHQNLNIRAALLHVLGDLVQSIGVLIAALITWYKPDWTIVDPLCTFIFTAIVMTSTWYLLRETSSILMQATPKGISLERAIHALLEIKGVIAIEDLHVWSLVPGKTVMSAKLKVGSGENVPEQARQLMRSRFGIIHCTVETSNYAAI